MIFVLFFLIISLSTFSDCMVKSAEPVTTWRFIPSDPATNLISEGPIGLTRSKSKQHEKYDLYKDAQADKYYMLTNNSDKSAIYMLSVNVLNDFRSKQTKRMQAEKTIRLEFNPSHLAINDARTIMLAAGVSLDSKLTAQLISLKNTKNKISLSGYDATSRSWFLRHGFSATEPNKVIVEYDLTHKEWALGEEELHHLTEDDMANDSQASVKVD